MRAAGFALLALLAYVPVLRSSPGRVAADTKSYLTLDPGRLLGRALSMWDPHVGMGTVTHQTIGYLFPMGPFFWTGERLGLPDWVVQRLWLGSLMFAAALGMVEYSAALNEFLKTLFPPVQYKMGLGETIARAGLKQLRIAETEKYAHVTFFFNGGEEKPFDGEERILVPSPKVQTYDLKPEMSAPEVTDKLVEAVSSDKFDLIVVNYANSDMVGHTGELPAAIKAIEAELGMPPTVITGSARMPRARISACAAGLSIRLTASNSTPRVSR